MAALYQLREQDGNSGEVQDLVGVCAATLCVDGHTVDAVRQSVMRSRGIFAGGLDNYSRYNSDPMVLQNLNGPKSRCGSSDSTVIARRRLRPATRSSAPCMAAPA